LRGLLFRLMVSIMGAGESNDTHAYRQSLKTVIPLTDNVYSNL
jgi:hypothetical protein